MKFDQRDVPKAFVLTKRMGRNGPITWVSRYTSWMVSDEARTWMIENGIDFETIIQDGQNDTLIVLDHGGAMKLKLRFG